MHACPSCAAPLDNEGICTRCGALARGFFRGLDLGAPQIADAVARGLDFYRLLGVAPDADIRAVARRYRQLRALFPDDPSNLNPEPARRLALLEAAGRILTDPRLRRMYEELRTGQVTQLSTEVLRCTSCAAPLGPEVAKCPFCGTPRPQEPAPPAAPAADPGPPAAEPVDYYAMLGLAPVHLVPSAPREPILPRNPLQPVPGGVIGLMALGAQASMIEMLIHPPGAPSPAAIDGAAITQERAVLLMAGYSQAEREARLAEIEIGRRILRDDLRRNQYDALLQRFRSGQFDHRQMDALCQLQDQVRAELAEERGEQLSATEGAAMLKQGLGYLNAHLPGEAVGVLRQAVKALPQSVEAHAAYARAILASDDPLALGGHMLREALGSLEALESLQAGHPQAPALAALCRGLLERDAGNTAQAEAALQQVTRLDSQIAPAWRGLAALALSRGAIEETLSYARRALALDPRDERALALIVGACLRGRRRDQAYDAAAQIASLRGEGWTANAVLHEFGM